MNNFAHYFLFHFIRAFCSTMNIFLNLPPVKSGPPCNVANYLCPAYQQGWNPHCQLGSEWSLPQIPGYCFSFLGSLLVITALTLRPFRNQALRVKRTRGSLEINDRNRKKGAKQDWAEPTDHIAGLTKSQPTQQEL